MKASDIYRTGSLLRLVCEGVEEANLLKYINFADRDAHGYSAASMLKAVLLAFTINGYASYRELEDYCQNDVRFMYIMNGETPSHESFYRFIHDDLSESVEEIFTALNKWMIEKDDIDTTVLTIDGTKLEANANKMTFVWMKATNKQRSKVWGKAMNIIATINRYCSRENIPVVFSILKEMEISYLNQVCEKLEEIAKEKNIEFTYGKGHRKSELQRLYDELEECAIKLWKYAIHIDIAEGRNSFSKTDTDATFMHMKYDYYNHTNVFKPGYNVQFGISDGYVVCTYVSADCNDLNTYIPLMDKYYHMYGKYPDKTGADSGYGSYDNYWYNELHQIEQFMKYSGYQKKKEKITEKNKFKAWAFRKDDGRIVCPAGHEFYVASVRLETRGLYPRFVETMKCDKCAECPLRSKCTKSKNGRALTRTRQLDIWQKEVDDNLSTDEGKKIMEQRRVYSEGKFGDMKSNWGFDKLHRRGKTGVKTEILLVAIGLNFRRMHTRQAEKEKLAKQKLPA